MQENHNVAVAEKAQKNTHLAKAIAAGTATLLVLSNSAHAVDAPLSVPDMAPVLGLIMGIVAIVSSIGMAVLSVFATGKVFKWVKSAF